MGGHALYEKALRPFGGVTGRAILLPVDRELLLAPLEAQLAALDASVSGYVADGAKLLATRELAPIPILGVPGWCLDNERETYYDNPDTFRPGRRAGGRRQKAEGRRMKGQAYVFRRQSAKIVVRFLPFALLLYIAWSARSSTVSRSAP
jgi:hypothetical protein